MEAQPVFIEGKRFALGTTEEKGLSKTFFANPFGPVQRQEKCMALIDKMFSVMHDNGVLLGEVFTHLGCEDKGPEALQQAAQAIIEEMK